MSRSGDLSRVRLRQTPQVYFVDAFSTVLQYRCVMRRLWLAILLTVALVTGGVANALAAQACPMQAAAQTQMTAHDCCPTGAGQEDDGQSHHQKPMANCVVGQPCRSTPAITPSLAPIALSAVAIKVSPPRLGNAAQPGLTGTEFWRPPRTA